MGFEKFHLQIPTSDARPSYKGGVSVLVTGRLTGKDDIKSTFSQSFFLVPQDNGFFVPNNMCRYVEGESAEPVSASQEEEHAESFEVSVPDPEPTIVGAPEEDHPEVEVKIVDNAEEPAVVKEDIAESFLNNIIHEDAQAAVLAPASDDAKPLLDIFGQLAPGCGTCPNGIQVRSSKGSCFGFVEFESDSAMRSALENLISPVANISTKDCLKR